MSDKPKPPPSDAPKILEKPKVEVTVTPKSKDPADRSYADKVKRSVQSDVEKAVAPREGDRSADQFKRAGGAVSDAEKKVDGGKVKEISVDVSGKVGKTTEKKTFEAKPPAPPEPPPKLGPAKPAEPAKAAPPAKPVPASKDPNSGPTRPGWPNTPNKGGGKKGSNK